jgi:hypothetical protein
MTRIGILTAFCALGAALATTAFAKPARIKVPASPVVRGVVPLAHSCGGGFVCRQDLFDRNNPNNIRSDYPGPSAQPGQF